jgi:hypothetical protein
LHPDLGKILLFPNTSKGGHGPKTGLGTIGGEGEGEEEVKRKKKKKTRSPISQFFVRKEFRKSQDFKERKAGVGTEI